MAISALITTTVAGTTNQFWMSALAVEMRGSSPLDHGEEITISAAVALGDAGRVRGMIAADPALRRVRSVSDQCFGIFRYPPVLISN